MVRVRSMAVQDFDFAVLAVQKLFRRSLQELSLVCRSYGSVHLEKFWFQY
jgi:hypothetical protein